MFPEFNTSVAETAMPRASYRLQLSEHFTLKQARELVPYLRALGISHLYTSPILQARPHSAHGYDTCDFTHLNPELGAEKDLAELAVALRAHGMGLVIDVVPNHMGIGGPENHWWWDVLTQGPQSPFAAFFDIDWNSPDPRLRGKVLAPVLGDRYHRVLARHELKVQPGQRGLILAYGENSFPINEGSLESIKTSVEELNANPDALDVLLEKQYYRLAWHGRGDAELNYRRFFNIAGLPGLAMENQQVFNQVFALIRQWLQCGWLDGLRVDHPDGLRDPEQFLQRLRHLAPRAWIVVEKILEEGESLPASWPVEGTTGYDFLNCAGGLFIDPNGKKPLTDIYSLFSGNSADFAAIARDKKRLALRTLLSAEVDRLTRLLLRIVEKLWRYRDFARSELSEALIELAACFPVYRTYARPGAGEGTEWGDSHVLAATAEARRCRADLPAELFDLFDNVLLLRQEGRVENEFVARFQQLTAATMAKGVEDTAFYCFNRLAALNEVGGNPGRFGVSIDEFHQFCRRQQNDWPGTMLASSTHDTKRSEDVRARLCLLSEIPGRWREALCRWSAMNERYHTHQWPDANAEYLFYQTLAGAWPLSAERALAYMQKASHEAKEHTNWTAPNAEYAAALRNFVKNTMADATFIADLENFVAPLLKPGCVNSLAQMLLKLTAPGVPDFYQGTELWDLKLVDPDNRTSVDFTLRQQLLARVAEMTAGEAWTEWSSGLPKLWLIRRVLNLRAQRPELFDASAQYEGIAAQGEASDHVLAFRRGDNLIAVVPRLVIGLSDNWRDTILPLPPGTWHNELTDEAVPGELAPMAELLARFPVALLVQKENL